ncbi:hypothetical protein SAMN04489725_12215 [Alicyclobacillus hesperidum]|uniref:Uncharacterized protein n=1 Tax=Alicyclobacillus hesperidum TaxID=89784 RepID=A0A1H2XLZ5_9BACL|nr:hypothetical protein SAMN04489725_12215 [Alicyclobacillus hesperidum]
MMAWRTVDSTIWNATNVSVMWPVAVIAAPGQDPRFP